MQAKELLLRARLRRVQAEAVLDPAARQALLDEAEEWETLAEEQEVFSSVRARSVSIETDTRSTFWTMRMI